MLEGIVFYRGNQTTERSPLFLMAVPLVIAWVVAMVYVWVLRG